MSAAISCSVQSNGLIVIALHSNLQVLGKLSLNATLIRATQWRHFTAAASYRLAALRVAGRYVNAIQETLTEVALLDPSANAESLLISVSPNTTWFGNERNGRG